MESSIVWCYMLGYSHLAGGFEFRPCCVHQEFVSFYFWVLFCCFSVHQLMDIWVVGYFFNSKSNSAVHIYVCFCADIYFHFCWVYP